MNVVLYSEVNDKRTKRFFTFSTQALKDHRKLVKRAGLSGSSDRRRNSHARESLNLPAKPTASTESQHAAFETHTEASAHVLLINRGHE